jgi:hypothetical protein
VTKGKARRVGKRGINRSMQSTETRVGYSEKNDTLENIMSSCSDDKQEKVIVIMAGDDSLTHLLLMQYESENTTVHNN